MLLIGQLCQSGSNDDVYCVRRDRWATLNSTRGLACAEMGLEALAACEDVNPDVSEKG